MSIKGFEVGGVQQQYDYESLDNIPANLVQDANYVHTGNNYTNADKTKLSGIEAQANKTTIDATLTQSGQAADAKATGDAISALDAQVIASMPHDTASGSIASFPDGAAMPVIDCSVAVAPNQDLNGYDNPWPAGGGKNLFDGEFLQGYWAFANGAFSENNFWLCTKKIPCKPSTYYVTSCSAMLTRFQGFVWYDTDGNYISSASKNENINIGQYATSPANAAYLVFNIAGYPGTTSPILPTDVSYFQLEEGKTATSYVPYENICPISGWTECKVYVSPTSDPDDATVYTIDLNGTRYGGTLDVTTGKLTVTDRYILADGTSVKVTGGYGAGGPIWLPSIVLTGANIGTTNSNDVRFSYLVTKDSIAGVQNNENTGVIGNSGAAIVLHIGTMQGTDGTHGYNSASAVQSAVNAYLSEHPLDIVYKLATPIEVDLTPAEITTLLGTNNIFADCGDTTVDYYADTTLFVNKKIAAAVAALS